MSHKSVCPILSYHIGFPLGVYGRGYQIQQITVYLEVTAVLILIIFLMLIELSDDSV